MIEIRERLLEFIVAGDSIQQKNARTMGLFDKHHNLSEQQTADLLSIYKSIADIRSLGIPERRNFFRKSHHIVESEQFTKSDIEKYINFALKLKSYLSENKNSYVRKLKLQKLLADKTVFNMFIERSSRTHRSFDAAAKILGANVINEKDSAGLSLMSRNESFADAIRTFSQYADLIVLRAPWSYATEEAILAQEKLEKVVPIINAGSGSAQHPTQGLLDVMTVKEVLKIKSFDELNNERVAIIGNKFKRATRSFMVTLHTACPKIKFTIIAPSGHHVEKFINKLGLNKIDITTSNSIRRGIQGASIVYLAGKEKMTLRQSNGLRLTLTDLSGAEKHCIVLHPLPRTDEMDYEIDQSLSNKIWAQTENGLYMRVVLLLDCFKRLRKLSKII